jgi:hypothetical protein
MSLVETNMPPQGGIGGYGPVGAAPQMYRGQAVTPPSKMSPEERYRVLQGWVRADAQFSRKWRKQAISDFDFRSGEQWSDDDKAVLRDSFRPVIVFNRVLTILKAVAGMEINGRHEIQFLPVGNEDTAPNELLSAASKWMAAGCDAEDEESEAFDNCSTCGMGWTENRITYEMDPMGSYWEESIDPLQMGWDCSARKRNLVDARRLWRIKNIPVSEAMVQFQGIDPDDMNAVWATDLGLEGGSDKSYEEKLVRDGEGSLDPSEVYNEDNTVSVVHIQWYELEPYYFLADPMTGQFIEMDDDKFQIYQRRMAMLGMDVTAARMQRRCYYQAFLGRKELRSQKSPIQDRFIWQCITGELDRKSGTWFGLIKVMRDPQMWANKWLSQTLHILNTTAKGGIIAEEDAFEDQEEAERTYAQPDSITWAASGAIGANPKIMEKRGQGITQGHVELMQFAISAIRDCTGINLELLGLKDQNQPGVLEAQRKQAGMTVLATLFDSLRRFRKGVGHVRLYMIQNYFSDGRLIRVAGPLAAQALPLLKDKTFGKYDVIIDDTPTSPNQKQANWAVIAPMIGLFKDQLAAKPELLAELLEYSPLPAQLVESIKQMVLADKNDPQAQQLKQTMQQLSIAAEVAKITKDQATADMNKAKGQSTMATAQYDLAMAQHLLSQGQIDQLKAHLDLATKRHEANKAAIEAGATQAKAHADVVKSRMDIINSILGHGHQQAMDNREQDRADVETAHNIGMDRAQHVNDVNESIARAHASHAKAQRDRIGAFADILSAHAQHLQATRPEPQNAP